MAFPSINTVHFPKTGFFACIELPQNVRASALENVLGVKGVNVVSTDSVFLPGFGVNSIIRLSISNVSEEQIKRGIGIIAETIASDFSGTNHNNKTWMEKFI